MATISVTLPDAAQSFVDRQANAGGFESGGEYVRDLVLREQERQALRERLLAGARSDEGSLADEAYFDRLRRRVRNRAS